jgi:hypothetical protein
MHTGDLGTLVGYVNFPLQECASAPPDDVSSALITFKTGKPQGERRRSSRNSLGLKTVTPLRKPPGRVGPGYSFDMLRLFFQKNLFSGLRTSFSSPKMLNLCRQQQDQASP